MSLQPLPCGWFGEASSDKDLQGRLPCARLAIVIADVLLDGSEDYLVGLISATHLRREAWEKFVVGPLRKAELLPWTEAG